MQFPQVWDQNRWRILKSGVDYWFITESRDRKLIGTKTVYETIGLPPERTEMVLELNLFQRGAVIQMWFRNKKKPELVKSRIMKGGNWIEGLNQSPVQLSGLTVKGEFVGVLVELKVAPDKTEAIDVYKREFDIPNL
jgi:hypothetical protein